MTNIPQISVIIPAHNEERFIGRAIRSLLAQSIPRSDFEIIVVDDASTDRTQYAMELFADEIQSITNKTNVGLPGSLNKAIKKALGKYIVRLDADDYVHADYLSLLRIFLEENTHWDAVCCDYILVDDFETVLSRKNSLKEPIGCGIMFRTDQLIEIGMYDDDFLMHEDRDLRHRFSQKHKINRIALPLYRYRQHDGNMTNNTDEFEQFETRLNSKHGL